MNRLRGHASNGVRGLLLGLAMLAACSSSTDEGPGNQDPFASRDLFCDAWARGACSSAVVDACGADDAATCQQSQAAVCRQLVDSSAYTRDNAEACFEGVKAAYSDARLTRAELDTLTLKGAPCDMLHSGSVTTGNSCDQDHECDTVSGAHCLESQSGGTRCLVPNEVGGGSKCSGDGDVCVDGFYCDGSNCLARAELNDACVDQPCLENLRCFAGTCSTKLKNLEACTSDDECDSGICGYAVGGSQGVCLVRIDLNVMSANCEGLR